MENIKSFTSQIMVDHIILIAIPGPSYECLYAGVSKNWRVNGSGVWNKCEVSKALDNNKLSLPSPRCLPERVQSILFVLIGDDAFALKANIIKLYPRWI